MPESNPNSRLEAFCDGVFAIAITLLVIEIRIPHMPEIRSTQDFWNALIHVIPAISAFLLSFVIIFITWVNHHASLKLVNKTSSKFIYANGFLLLTVAFLPFPTSLLGEYLTSGNGTPAVFLYNLNLSLQAIGWIFIHSSVIGNKLYKSESALAESRTGRKFGVFASFLYAAFAVLAFWFPITIAIANLFTWIFWLIYGIRIKIEQ